MVKAFTLRAKANDDLVAIYRYTVREWGLDRAESYIRSINEAFKLLADNGYLGHDASYIRPQLRAHISGSHIIFYKPTRQGVTIIRVLHKSMDYLSHL